VEQGLSPDAKGQKGPQSSANAPGPANLPRPGSPTSAPILKFPKQFKKRLFRDADRRFLVILFLSFLTTFFAIRYMFAHRPTGTNEELITRIQNQYASRFLSGYRLPKGSRGEASMTRSKILDSASELARKLAEEGGPMQRYRTEVQPPEAGNRRNRASSFEEREQMRESSAQRRQRSVATLREEVQNIGLLGVMAGSDEDKPEGEVQDLLAFADSTASKFQDKVDNLSGMRTALPGADFYGPGLGDDHNFYLPQRDSKTSRVTTSPVPPSGVVSDLAETRDETLKHKNQFQAVSSGNQVSIGVQQHSIHRYARRTAEDIRKVVLSHNLAIQDCYRLELKYDPGLRGKITVRLTIDSLGRVTHVEILRSSIAIQRMQDCILAKIRRWNDFGIVPREQGDVTIRHTYLFGY